MAPSILFLSSPKDPHNDNHVRLPAMFQAARWQVAEADHEDLVLLDGQLLAAAAPLRNYDVIWSIGLGPARSFSDRMQLLNLVDPAKLMVPVSTLLLQHGKSAWLGFAPTSFVSMHAATLAAAMHSAAASGDNTTQWILKPNAGSQARNVFHVHAPEQIATLMAQAPPGYWVLQRHISAIAQGEIRTLVCGEQVLGSYRRLPNDQGITNLAAGGTAVVTELDTTSARLVAQVHARLLAQNVGFAAIDTAGGYLVETNVANPGGLQTLTELYGCDLGEQIVGAVSARHLRGQPGSSA